MKLFSLCCNAENVNYESTCSECNKETTHYKVFSCRGCGEDFAQERRDYYGITTGHWCDKCYDCEDTYSYRKDRYPTIEYDGWGEYLDFD